MTEDAVDRKVRRILREGVAPPRDPSRYDPRDWCGCLDHRDEHHGPAGDGPCSAEGCDCEAFSVADIECPDCLTVWAMSTLDACPSCGLTLLEIAERSAVSDTLR